MDWSIIRLGTRNRLLTKRDRAYTHEWLAMDTYMDLFMNDPEFDRDLLQPLQRHHLAAYSPGCRSTVETTVSHFS